MITITIIALLYLASVVWITVEAEGCPCPPEERKLAVLIYIFALLFATVAFATAIYNWVEENL